MKNFLIHFFLLFLFSLSFAQKQKPDFFVQAGMIWDKPVSRTLNLFREEYLAVNKSASFPTNMPIRKGFQLGIGMQVPMKEGSKSLSQMSIDWTQIKGDFDAVVNSSETRVWRISNNLFTFTSSIGSRFLGVDFLRLGVGNMQMRTYIRLNDGSTLTGATHLLNGNYRAFYCYTAPGLTLRIPFRGLMLKAWAAYKIPFIFPKGYLTDQEKDAPYKVIPTRYRNFVAAPLDYNFGLCGGGTDCRGGAVSSDIKGWAWGFTFQVALNKGAWQKKSD